MKVVEGMNVVKAMEACGQGSGKPSEKVVIKDCGELGGAAASAGEDTGERAAKRAKTAAPSEVPSNVT